MGNNNDNCIISDEIWVNEFNEKSAQNFRSAIKKKSSENPNAPIIIYIDSYGGNVDALAKMIGTMNEVPNSKITVCVGKAMSAGAILLSHGDVRYCEKNSRIMIHEVSTCTFGNINDVINDTEESKRLNAHFMKLLADNCKIKGGYTGLKKIFKDRDCRDIFLDAKAAQKFGIIDEIGLPTINSAMLFEISTAPEHKNPVPSIKQIISKEKKNKKKKTKKKKK